MQQQQQNQRRFADTAPVPVVHRFPQNSPQQGWQPQGNYPAQQTVPPEPEHVSRRKHGKPRKRRSSLWWNLLAVIGLITLLVQLARYVVIPVLVYLNVLTGGAA